MTLNISPETKVGKIEGWTVEKHLMNKDRKYEGKFLGDYIDTTGDELDKILKDNSLAISANGVLYRVDRKGIIPQILEEWFKDKDNFDKLQKQYGNKGDKEKEKYYAQRRTIAKVMLNSVYGVLGLPVFRFYDLDNAEAVTTTGVNIIQYTEKMGNFYYNQIVNGNSEETFELELENGEIIEKKDNEEIEVLQDGKKIKILVKNIQETDEIF